MRALPPRLTLAQLEAADLHAMVNPCARLPVAVVLDTSGSMHGKPIEELQEALDLFLDAVAADPDARDACDLAFLSVGGKVEVLRPFAVAKAGGLLQEVRAGGVTPMGEGVVAAMRLLEARSLQHTQVGNRCYRPWLVLLTDGHASDDTTEAEQRVSRELSARRLTVMPVALGPKPALDRLQALAGGTPPARLSGLNFRAFFRWLSASMTMISRSIPGDRVQLPSPFEWVQT